MLVWVLAAEVSFVSTLIRLSELTQMTDSGSCKLGGWSVEFLAELWVELEDFEVGVSGRLIVTFKGGLIGKMSREMLLEEWFECDVDGVLDDFLDMDRFSLKILDLLVKYLSRLV